MAKPRALNGRTATQRDVDAGQVIFYVPDGRSTPYRFGHDLPLPARLINSDETTGFAAGTVIEVLQAEVGDTGDVLIGFVTGTEEGICMLHEIELLD
jgi:hypothetical protein